MDFPIKNCDFPLHVSLPEGILQMVGVGLYCDFFSQIHLFQEELIFHLQKHLSLGKAGAFTLESHIHVKALKMQGSPNN